MTPSDTEALKTLVERRIPAALKRITDGHGLMRVPAEDTDPDLVLADCKIALERMLASQAAGPSKDLITLTGNQAEAILEAFGGDATTVTIRDMEAFKDAEDGSNMPAGLYLYYTEYPEEGIIFLGAPDQEYKPFYINRSAPPLAEPDVEDNKQNES